MTADELHCSINTLRNTATVDEPNETEKELLRQFRLRLRDVLKGDETDYYLLRWLVARRFNLGNAEKMLRDHLALRKQADLDNMIAAGHELPEIIKKYVSLNFIGRDKEGNEIVTILAGSTDVKGIAFSVTLFDILISAAYLIETMERAMEERHRKEGTRGTKFVIICDVKALDFSRLINRLMIKGMILVIRMYEANYPETLKSAYVLNAPGLFYALFNLVKGFFDDRTLSKIHIYKGYAEKDLLEVVDADILPAFWGGKRTDPDGNPECRTMYVRNPKIPKYLYYRFRNFERIRTDPKYIKIIIPQRSYYDHVLEVKDIGVLIHWSFCTLEYNIKYGIYFVSEEAKRKKCHTKEWLEPLDFAECHLVVHEWQWYCHKPGTYVIHFDNTYSWMTPKTLYYQLHSREPENTAL